MLNRANLVAYIEVTLDPNYQVAIVEYEFRYNLEIDRVIVRVVVKNFE